MYKVCIVVDRPITGNTVRWTDGHMNAYGIDLTSIPPKKKQFSSNKSE